MLQSHEFATPELRYRVHAPPSSVPKASPHAHAFRNDPSSTPEPFSDTEFQIESPSKTVARIVGSLSSQRPWHPRTNSPTQRPGIWPITDVQTRESIRQPQRELLQRLKGLKIPKYATFMAYFGPSVQSAVPAIILLLEAKLPEGLYADLGRSVKVVPLRFSASQPAIHDTLFNQYVENPSPGCMIGVNDRPMTSFTSGWWVRDCDTGSVFNLTAAHPLRNPRANVPHSWQVTTESLKSQLVDCPPVCLINATTLALRHEINKLRSQTRRQAQIDEKVRLLEEAGRCLTRRDFATVVAAGYGEYEVREKDETKFVLEDWSLLRARSDRVGKNQLPVVGFSHNFKGVGEIKIGAKVIMYGSTSGLREGLVMDEIVERIEHHDRETKSWIVVEKSWGVFGNEGDSGAPIGLEGGLAGGTYIAGGNGEFEGGVQFPFSTITALTTTFERIRQQTGRRLEIPSVSDLSKKWDRDQYHLQKTGTRRVRH
jgi:hypothetical protein